MFWDRFSSLCTESGKSPNAVAKELGIPSGSITAWKNGSAPRNITLVKIASYFDVSTDYLSSREQEKSPAPLGAELTEMQKTAVEFILRMDEKTLERFIAAAKAMLGEA